MSKLPEDLPVEIMTTYSDDYGTMKTKFYKSRYFDATDGIERAFSLEVEVEHEDGSDFNYEEHLETKWPDEEDGSLCENAGREYKLGIVQGNRGFLEIDTLFKQLRDFGYGATEACGLHVHFDARDLTEQQICNIASFVKVHEQAVFGMIPRSRQKNYGANPLDISLYTINNEKKDKSIREFFETSRYKGFNVQSYTKHSTLEIRYHGGTLDPIKMKNWIRMWLHIIESQKDTFWTHFDDEVVLAPKSTKTLVFMLRRCNAPEEVITFSFKRFAKFSLLDYNLKEKMMLRDYAEKEFLKSNGKYQEPKIDDAHVNTLARDIRSMIRNFLVSDTITIGQGEKIDQKFTEKELRNLIKSLG